MEQLLLMRATLQERAATVFNFFYRSSLLIIDVTTFIFFILFVQINFIHHTRDSVTNSSLTVSTLL